jgi:serine protease
VVGWPVIRAGGIALTIVFVGGFAASVRAAEPGAACQADQLKAAAALCKADFRCLGSFVKKPAKDPLLLRLDACWAKADVRFAGSYDKALSKAAAKGGVCGLGDPAFLVRDEINLDTLELMLTDPPDPGGDILSGWGFGFDPDDDTLHAGILKAVSKLCGKVLKIESANAKKPDPAGTGASRGAARQKFLGAVAKAEAKGQAKGVAYAGLPPAEVADAIEALVDDLVTRSVPPGLETFRVSGTIFPAEASFVDGDVNDPTTPFVPNDDGIDDALPSVADRAAAQALPVPSSLGGYANLAGQGPVGRSRIPGDLSDYYALTFAAGQTLTLQLEPDFGDLDLYLYDQNGAFVDASTGVAAFETLVAPSSGSFFVEVFAFGGGSAYVLTLGQPVAAAQAAPRAPRFSDAFVPGELLVTMPPQARAAKAAGASSRQARALELGLAARGGAPEREMLLALGADAASRAQTFQTLAAKAPEAASPRRPTGLSAEDALRFDTLLALKTLRVRDDVSSADLNHLRQALFTPNDTFYSFQWHYPLINLPQAWEVTRGAASVIVAVVDTGVLLSHPDLAGQLVAGYDFISDPANAVDGNGIDPNPDDPGDDPGGSQDSFHGTHVAGTVAAATNNGLGVAGVAGDARVMPLRVLGPFGGTTFDIIQALRFAARLGNDSGTLPPAAADVINLSLGGPGFSLTEQNAFDTVRSEGLIVVAAAGNSSSSAPSYPAAYAGVNSVSAVDLQSNLAGYSNFGSAVDVSAPGGDTGVDRNGDGFADGVLSTLAAEQGGGPLAYNYVFYQGTSMATPHVAGVAALMKAVAPTTLTPDAFDLLLASGAMTQDLGAAGRDDFFGHGLVDAAAAVAAALDLENGSPPVIDPVLVVSPQALNFGAVLAEIPLALSNGGGGSLSISAINQDSGGWLSVVADSVDGDGLGSYRVLVDRTGLPDGPARATIQVVSTEGSVEVAVVMQVGGSGESDMGTQFVLLLDAVTGDRLAQLAVTPLNGAYAYEFPAVRAGEYTILAGTDLDNDFALCHVGESCGAYQTLDLMTPVPVAADVSGLDFVTTFQQSFGPTGMSRPAQRTRSGDEPRRIR